MEVKRTMINNKLNNNQVTISGEIVSNFEFNHEVYGEGFYVTQLEVERKSKRTDVVSIMVSERLVDVKTDWTGKFVRISGQFRSYNCHEEVKNRLVLSVFAREFEETGEIPFANDENNVFLDGYVCKPPIYRKTPLGREVTDVILAVNRLYRKSDYIPTIFWGRNSRFVSKLSVGTRLRIKGRIQSRSYTKRISEEKSEEKIAYEVSVSKVEIPEN